MSNNRVRADFNRAAALYDRVAFLQREVGNRLVESLDCFKIDPQCVLDLGSGTGVLAQKIAQKYTFQYHVSLDIAEAMLIFARKNHKTHQSQAYHICGDAAHIPLETASVDLIYSNLMLQWCDNLQGVFHEVRRILKPNGLFLFSTFGADTLKELRNSWLQAGMRKALHTFFDLHDVGDLLLAESFTDPVVNMEVIELKYANVPMLLKDLRILGAGNKQQAAHTGLVGRVAWQQFIALYDRCRDDQGYYPVTYEVIYGHAWGGGNTANILDPTDTHEVRLDIPPLFSHGDGINKIT